jgi:hypothetical protein
MGVAGDLAAHGAQAEALGGVIGGGLDPAIVEGQRLGAAAFEKELSVIGAARGLLQVRQRRIPVKQAVEGAKGGVSHGGASYMMAQSGGRADLIQIKKSVRLPQCSFLSFAAEYGFRQHQDNGIPPHAAQDLP